MMGVPRAVVGIGASAGGLEAFRLFFETMPATSGIAFIVILHLPANRKSMLPEILSRWTSLRVIEASDGVLVEPDCIYVPPPQATTAYVGGRLMITVPTAQSPRADWLIDHMFDSLAANLQEAAVGIVLSGSGSDGALGLKAIKEAGGLTMAQGVDGTAPQYEGMPAGAIATGAVDLVTPVEDMPGHLIRLTAARLAEAQQADQPHADAEEAARIAICTVLRERLNHDFSGYKEKTFLRRVQRRMQVLGIDTIGAYVARLQRDHDEALLLFRDLLIRVTSFFRDAEAFDSLNRVAIPRLFDGVMADGVVRVWVPGCATGEEAYSLAILLQEYMDQLRSQPRVQIFATDIDDAAIATARAGRYPSTLLEGLSEERRQRFFNQTNTGYVVGKDIRNLCTFSEHSLVRDPPFSRINLVSCRNLLIYMDNDLQTRVIPAFHYALQPGGILLLGTSETTSRHEELFETLDKPARIFLRRDVRSPQLHLFKAAGGQARFPVRSTTANPGAMERASARRDDAGVTDRGRRLVAEDMMPEIDPWARPTLRGVIARLQGLGLGWSLRAEFARQQTELTRTTQQLQSITEEHETALEELRSSNEELQSVNEEFQSTNEELETSKEEIQSVNEELHTVNRQLSEKVDELDRTNSDLKNLFESTDVATIFLDPHLIIRGYTPAVGTIYNLIPSDHGRPITDIVHNLAYGDLREDVTKVLRSLLPLERRVEHKDGRTHFIMRILPYRAPDSTVNGTLVTFLDVTSIVQAELHQKLLVDELNHRVKNMLTVVISLALQTLRRSQSLDDFSAAFMGRVHGLTASYTLLSSVNWAKVSLRDILTEEIKPFFSPENSNFVADGPLVLLEPQGALAFGMAIHELATNAVKYGALSVPEGCIRTIWRVDGEAADAPEFIFQWIEENGPVVKPPTHRGFGMTLIERGFVHEMSGSSNVDFDPYGVRATLRAPLGSMMSTQPPEPA